MKLKEQLKTFDRKILIEQSEYHKDSLSDDRNYQSTQHNIIRFWVFVFNIFMANTVKMVHNAPCMVQNSNSLSKAYFEGHDLLSLFTFDLQKPIKGVQWLSGRGLDSRQRDRKFEPHWHHCAVSFRKTHLS